MAALIALLVGCEAPHHPAEAEPMLTLGHLDSGAFQQYLPNQDVTLVAGAQGGFHVWLAFQMAPALSGDAMLERTAHRASDEQLILRTQGQIALDSSEALPMFMCPAPVGISVIDQPIEYRLRFTSASGELASGTITLVPHCPSDQLEFCQRICNG
jgi:hypothetical protein